MSLFGKRVARAPVRPLSWPEKLELLIGPSRFRPAFDDDEARRAAWVTHREELLHAVNPTTRPWAFWQFDRPDVDRGNDDDATVLRRIGELRDDEVVALARWEAEARAKAAGAVARGRAN